MGPLGSLILCILPPPGPGHEECIHCAKDLHFQDWKCLQACEAGFFPEAMPGLPHKVCRRWALHHGPPRL